MESPIGSKVATVFQPRVEDPEASKSSRRLKGEAEREEGNALDLG